MNRRLLLGALLLLLTPPHAATAAGNPPPNWAPASTYGQYSDPQQESRGVRPLTDTLRGNSENGAPLEHSVTSFSQSPWFALSSGLASIIGLLFALYTTQVKPIPYSLYRSLVWRKSLLLALGVGTAVFACIQLVQFDGAFRRVVEVIVFFLSDRRNQLHFYYPSGYLLTFFWIFLVGFGCSLSLRGVRFDPIAHARDIIVREQAVIAEARRSQIDELVGDRPIEGMSLPERRALRDTMDFYRYIQWRYADVVLGAPPPSFPLFSPEALREVSEDDA